jgi:carbon storage regulator
MLILTRRVGEAILMDGDVRVVVLDIDGQGVRLGIEAPPSVGILREEVVKRIAEENIRAGAEVDKEAILRTLASQATQKDGGPPAEPDPDPRDRQKDTGDGGQNPASDTKPGED